MRLVMACLLVLTGSCRLPDASTRVTDGPWHEGAPNIAGLELSCDPVDERWELFVRTDAWAAGAYLWVTEDGAIVEKHTALSVDAEDDGSEDCLRARFAIAEDARDAGVGASRWRCDETRQLSFVVAVSDSRDQVFTDCRIWGADIGVWSDIAGPPSCGTRLEDGPDTGAVVGDEGSWGECDF